MGGPDATEVFEVRDNQIGPDCELLGILERSCRHTDTLTDDFKLLEGAPCSIQLFTTTLRDEECLEMAKQIDDCLKGKQ